MSTSQVRNYNKMIMFCRKKQPSSFCSIRKLMVLTLLVSVTCVGLFTVTSDLESLKNTMKSMWGSVTTLFSSEEILEINKNVIEIGESIKSVQISVRSEFMD